MKGESKMPTIRYLKNADIIIEAAFESVYYFLEKGFSITLRHKNVSRSFILWDVYGVLISDAVEGLNSGFALIAGEIPGYTECCGCGTWVSIHDTEWSPEVEKMVCLECHDRLYRDSLKEYK
jgi:hypothetical protein